MSIARSSVAILLVALGFLIFVAGLSSTLFVMDCPDSCVPAPQCYSQCPNFFYTGITLLASAVGIVLVFVGNKMSCFHFRTR